MKKLIAILILGTLISCTDHFAELNTDKKSLAVVPGESLFNNGMERFYHTMNNNSVNFNVFKLYAQFQAQTTYPDESQYNMVTRNIPDNWFSRVYKDGLRDLKEARKIIAAVETAGDDSIIQKNKLAIITINEVHMMSTLVDLFGNVPYTQALDFENPNPVYDDAKTIYYSIIDNLDKAISDLNTDYASFEPNNDLLNQGDTGMWKKAANSIKLRLAMRIADTDPSKAQAMAESAYMGAFSGVDENLSMEYTTASPYTYPAYEDIVLSGRSDYVGANTLIDKMNMLEDPRRSAYFQGNIVDEAGDVIYVGGAYGSANSFANSSQLGSLFHTSDSPGITMSCSEVEFLKAEGAARGFNMGGSEEELYNNAITTSIMEWGGSQADADTYLAQEMVAYATADGDWRQKIGSQKWLSLFGEGGIEGWTTWRLLDFEGFNTPEGLEYSDIPNRLIYPIDEATLNGPSVDAAAAAIGGDTKQTKIFWDVN